jgi:release factor glutamine methyltransferase
MEKDLAWLIGEKYGGNADDPRLAEDKERLAAGEPLAYVIGWQPFLGLRIFLDSHPLIPRPETEWWVEELIRGTKASKMLDLCAGSGAAGCAILAQVPDAQVSFGEIDSAHEATIRKNLRENGLDEARATVRIGDLFAPFAGETFDVIAANPPYIPLDRALDRSVTEFEPELALRSGADGLALIRRIAEEAPAHMHEGGELWMECDAEHAEAAKDLVAAHAKSAELRTDPYGRPRLVVGYY